LLSGSDRPNSLRQGRRRKPWPTGNPLRLKAAQKHQTDAKPDNAFFSHLRFFLALLEDLPGLDNQKPQKVSRPVLQNAIYILLIVISVKRKANCARFPVFRCTFPVEVGLYI
jgi:hypothetical protein